MEQRELLSAIDISKYFGEVGALKEVSFSIPSGMTVGLIGENGSGKSTISSIFAGILKPSKGGIRYLNEEFHPKNMIDALDQGIGMIVQEEGTVSGITVAENIFLGNLQQFKKGGFLLKKSIYAKAQQILDDFGLEEIRANQLVDVYSQEERKLIEVVKVLMKEPKVLIVDETTTALSQKGRDFIYNQMEQQKTLGHSSLFISHDLEELVAHCDQLIILRDGDLIDILNKKDFDEDRIKALMVGRKLTGAYYREDFLPSHYEEVALSVNDLGYQEKVKHISFELHRGEILGIGGLSHCGMHDLGKLLFGYLEKGTGVVDVPQIGSNISSVQEAMAAKIGYVSKNRDHEALALNSSVRDNIAIAGLDLLSEKFGYISSKKETAYVEKQINELKIKTPSMNQEVQFLSGGNKQKVVFGKWLGRDCDILILDCPTRGVDIGVKAAMYRLMEKMKKQGKAIILISEELPELIGMSDRILIMKDGQLEKSFDRSANLEDTEIIQYMI